jgi:hypothetical protein
VLVLAEEKVTECSERAALETTVGQVARESDLPLECRSRLGQSAGQQINAPEVADDLDFRGKVAGVCDDAKRIAEKVFCLRIFADKNPRSRKRETASRAKSIIVELDGSRKSSSRSGALVFRSAKAMQELRAAKLDLARQHGVCVPHLVKCQVSEVDTLLVGAVRCREIFKRRPNEGQTFNELVAFEIMSRKENGVLIDRGLCFSAKSVSPGDCRVILPAEHR